MVTHIFTKEQQEKKRLEKLQQSLIQDIQMDNEQLDVVYERKYNPEIVQNIWYKLYLLQNYNVTQEMFQGSCLRWSSIRTYLTHIRAIYKGYKYKEPITKSLVDYITGIIDSGTEPYPLPKNAKTKVVTIQELLESNILTPHQIRYIYEGVGPQQNLPDTSIAWTQAHNERTEHETHGSESYTNIVIDNPIQEVKTNPISKLQAIKPQGKFDLSNIFKFNF